jgi:hypothetical protein
MARFVCDVRGAVIFFHGGNSILGAHCHEHFVGVLLGVSSPKFWRWNGDIPAISMRYA